MLPITVSVIRDWGIILRIQTFRAKWFARSVVAVLIAMVLLPIFSGYSTAQPLPTIQLEPGRDAAPFSKQLRYQKPYDGPIQTESLLASASNYETLTSSNIQFGTPDGKILVLLSVQNSGDVEGSWILTTGRGSLKFFQLYELLDLDELLLIDGTDLRQVKENLQSYQAFSHEVLLSPGETKTYAIHFEPENVSNLPLKIQTYSTFFQARRANIALVASVAGGVLILIFINAIFFWVTNKPEFVWLAIAELFFAINTLHAEGYTTIYWLFDKPLLSLALGDILKCGFAGAMAQTARSFLGTRSHFPKTDVFLRGLIGFCLLICALQLGVAYYSAGFKSTLHLSSWIATSIVALYLPTVALVAVRRFGSEYWPLVIAWGSLGIFILYGFIASMGVFSGLPVNWHLAGPIGLFEAAMTTLALGLHVRKIQKQKSAADAKLAQSLQEQLEISEQAKTLSEQRALALATIHDQNSMLHATGHDSRQVVMALKSAIAHLEKTDNTTSNAPLASMLKASADYLNDIISTTMSGARMSDGSSQFVALGLVNVEDLIGALDKIYATSFHTKALSYEAVYVKDLVFISDQALLLRVLSNIVSNSLKFTKHGGVTINVQEIEGTLVFVITDTGIGISPSTVGKLNSDASKFAKEDLSTEGAGSGFRFAQAIVKKLGGHLKIASRQSKETIVTIRLPLIAPGSKTDFAGLSAPLPDNSMTDIDAPPSHEEESSSQIAVTYDTSSTTRSELAKAFSLMLLKPLYTGMLDHPSLRDTLK